MPAPSPALTALQEQIWAGSIPLEIRLASSDCSTYDQADPYLVGHQIFQKQEITADSLRIDSSSALVIPAIPPTTTSCLLQTRLD